MDFNIGCALHFASKGEGYLFDKAFFETAHFAEIRQKIEAPASG
jgi:hypothetical protein